MTTLILSCLHINESSACSLETGAFSNLSDNLNKKLKHKNICLLLFVVVLWRVMCQTISWLGAVTSFFETIFWYLTVLDTMQQTHFIQYQRSINIWPNIDTSWCRTQAYSKRQVCIKKCHSLFFFLLLCLVFSFQTYKDTYYWTPPPHPRCHPSHSPGSFLPRPSVDPSRPSGPSGPQGWLPWPSPAGPPLERGLWSESKPTTWR